MSTTPDNPYESPQAPGAGGPTWQQACPECGCREFSFWKLHLKEPLFRTECPGCGVWLRLRKSTLGKILGFISVWPFAIVMFLAMGEFYSNPWLLVATLAVTFAADCAIDHSTGRLIVRS